MSTSHNNLQFFSWIMRDEYDFSDAKRENPYVERINKYGYAIVVNCGAAQNNSSGTDDNPSAGSVAEYKVEYKKANS